MLASYSLNDKKMIEGLEILLWFITNKYIDRETYIAGVKEIVHILSVANNYPKPADKSY